MSNIDYSDKIPNNVNLSEDRTLQRALEQWQPNYLSWWQDMGPDGSQNFDVYLRTAVSVDPQGWAQFDYVKMPDYRWGIFLNPAREGPQDPLRRPQGRGRLAGRARRVPRQPAPHHRDAGRHRAGLGRAAAPSRPDLRRRSYDLRNLFQVNVEEGRHLWAMVYLLHKYFGRDGREEGRSAAGAPLAATRTTRASCGASTKKTPDWLSFFMFTYFTDRDGKFQLCALAESSASIRWRAPPSSC